MDSMFAAVWAAVHEDDIIGVGTGKTVESWLAYGIKHGFKLGTVVPSSLRTAEILKGMGCNVSDLQSEISLDNYIDSADEVGPRGYCIKGGGGAMTLEKIVCSAARKFTCMIDTRKSKQVLGEFPIAVEVLSIARSFVGRRLLAMGGNPVYREGFISDFGNIIIDVYGLNFNNLLGLERDLDAIPGVVGHGLFVSNKINYLYVSEGLKHSYEKF